MANAANEEELSRRRSSKAKSQEQNELELKLIISDVRKLLDRIEDAVPLINLAITTSGVSLSTNLPATVSPSRLLQASTFLTAADSQYALQPGHNVQVGPVYTLSMYMLFAGHAWRPHDDDDIRETTWKEVIHKARLKLLRVPLDRLHNRPGEATSRPATADGDYFPQHIPSEGASSEFAYQLLIIEDLDDDRVHTLEEDEPQPGPYQDVPLAGIRDIVPIHEISKIFYADTGKILNIGTDGETNNPVLLLRRDVNADPPRRMVERQQTEGAEDDYSPVGASEDPPNNEDYYDQSEIDAQILRESTPVVEKEPVFPPAEATKHQTWRLPPDLDPEWIAFEVYTEEPDTDDESELPSSEIQPAVSMPPNSRQPSLDPSLTGALSNLNLASPSPAVSPVHLHTSTSQTIPTSLLHPPSPAGPIKTSLSLLEMLIRLTALQQFRQANHLTIEDELLNFFLEDSSTTGAGPNAEYRQRVRRDARRRVGFDPYDESPIKRRGEEYISHPNERGTPAPPTPTGGWAQYGEGGYYNETWQRARSGTPESVRQSIEYPAYSRASPSVPSSPSPRLPLQHSRSSPNPGTPARTQGFTSTPPGSAVKGRHAFLRSMSEKPRSPLARGVVVPQGKDSALGTSPSAEELKPGEEQTE